MTVALCPSAATSVDVHPPKKCCECQNVRAFFPWALQLPMSLLSGYIFSSSSPFFLLGFETTTYVGHSSIKCQVSERTPESTAEVFAIREGHSGF